MNIKDTSLLLAEYNALRDEIIKRMDVENQLTAFTIIVFGTIMGIGFQNKTTSLILLFPALALFLSIGWSHSDARTMQIGAYISEHIESAVGTENIGWEHHMAANRHSMYYWANKGIFLITEVIAIFVAMLIGQSTKTIDLTVYALLVIAIVSFLLTLIVVLHPTLVKSSPSNASKIHQVK